MYTVYFRLCINTKEESNTFNLPGVIMWKRFNAILDNWQVVRGQLSEK